MFRDFFIQKACILLVGLATCLKPSFALCVIADKGEFKEETYTEQVNCRQAFVYNYGWETRCDDAVRTKKILVGPTTFYCTNSTLQEVYENNEESKGTKNQFYIFNSSLNSLITDGKTWPRITKLTLENDNVSQIVPGFFNGFTELILLSIPHNNITELSNGVFSSLTNLVHLNLSYNLLSNLEPLSFIGLSKVEIIDLHHNKIFSLSPKLFSQSNLTYLDLSDNVLKIPYDFSTFPLKKIFLQNNDFSEFIFPKSSGIIQILDISNSNIKKIDNFEYFEAYALNVSFNYIEGLDNVGKINEINISHNKLKVIGEYFISVKATSLDLSFNFISTVSSEAFTKGKELKYLYLNNNKLKELLPGSFKNQEQLEYLDLSGNNILYFEFGIFNNLRSLKSLNISYNEGIIDFQALFRLSQLEKLDFEKNQPSNFDEFFFDTHVKLKEIRMGYNTWNCGELVKVIHLMEKRDIKVLKGNNDNSVHVHGIECNSNLQSTTKNTLDVATGHQAQENLLNNSIVFSLIDKLIEILNKSDKNPNNYEAPNISTTLGNSLKLTEDKMTENGPFFNNVNLVFANILLSLLFCSSLLTIWYLRNQNLPQHHCKEQVELL